VAAAAPRVSVIMAAYEGERYIEQSMRSVLGQTFGAFELVVIDDGSTDGTWEIVNALAAADERIVYAFQPNRRQGPARNNGIRRARGEWIAFCDQDDLWGADKLERQFDAIDAAGDAVDVVFSDGWLFYDDDWADERTTFKTIHGRYDGPEMFRLLFAENRIPVLSSLTRRQAILDVGLLNEDPIVQNCDDWDLWLRLARAGARFLAMPDKLVRYRLHSAQASRDVNGMGKAEIAVLEQFRGSPLLPDGAAEADLTRRYGKLVDGLVGAGRFEEAATWAGKWLRADRSWDPLWRAAVARLYPRGFAELARTEQRVRWLAEDPIAHGVDFLRRKLGA
jgi:glycosyltransferase involved in cell wall biosynthesis